MPDKEIDRNRWRLLGYGKKHLGRRCILRVGTPTRPCPAFLPSPEYSTTRTVRIPGIWGMRRRSWLAASRGRLQVAKSQDRSVRTRHLTSFGLKDGTCLVTTPIPPNFGLAKLPVGSRRRPPRTCDPQGRPLLWRKAAHLARPRDDGRCPGQVRRQFVSDRTWPLLLGHESTALFVGAKRRQPCRAFADPDRPRLSGDHDCPGIHSRAHARTHHRRRASPTAWDWRP